MKRTNETIFAEIKAKGFITMSDMKLLKNRSNIAGRGLFDYNLIEEINDGYGIPLEKEWQNKGFIWLNSLIKSNGEPKKGQNLGYREINIIKTSSPDDFTFEGFYNAGIYGYHNFVPLYKFGEMEYYCVGGKINVVG